MNWDNEKVLIFIKEYEKRPVLWKKTDEFYFSATKKEDAWREIGTILDEDPEMLKRKMESLRGSRRREKHRYLKSLKSGKGHPNIYVSRWFAWDSLKFLDEPDDVSGTFINHTGPKQEIEDDYEQNNYEENGTRSEEDFEQNSENSTAEGTADLEERTHQIEKVYSSEKTKAATNQFWTRRRTSRKRVTQDTRVEKAYRVVKGKSTCEGRDDCALFAEFIAEKLRKFNGRQRAILQHEIHNLVFQAEIDPVS